MSNIDRQQQLFTREHGRRGWFTGEFRDQPHEMSAAHRHGDAHLLILEGSVELTLDGTETVSLQAGGEIDIKQDQLHATVAGAEGFRYAFACSPEEAERQGLTQ
jgi:quercetin dioxygenase-like cupin family protein